jgi:hypothetical protein
MIAESVGVEAFDICLDGEKTINDVHQVHHVHHHWNDSLTAVIL